jgi:hypothetical protein
MLEKVGKTVRDTLKTLEDQVAQETGSRCPTMVVVRYQGRLVVSHNVGAEGLTRLLKDLSKQKNPKQQDRES